MAEIEANTKLTREATCGGIAPLAVRATPKYFDPY